MVLLQMNYAIYNEIIKICILYIYGYDKEKNSQEWKIKIELNEQINLGKRNKRGQFGQFLILRALS